MSYCFKSAWVWVIGVQTWKCVNDWYDMWPNFHSSRSTSGAKFPSQSTIHDMTDNIYYTCACLSVFECVHVCVFVCVYGVFSCNYTVCRYSFSLVFNYLLNFTIYPAIDQRSGGDRPVDRDGQFGHPWCRSCKSDWCVRLIVYEWFVRGTKRGWGCRRELSERGVFISTNNSLKRIKKRDMMRDHKAILQRWGGRGCSVAKLHTKLK